MFGSANLALGMYFIIQVLLVPRICLFLGGKLHGRIWCNISLCNVFSCEGVGGRLWVGVHSSSLVCTLTFVGKKKRDE